MRLNIKFKEGATSYIDWQAVEDTIHDYPLVAQTPPMRLFTIEVADDEIEATMEYLRSLDHVERVLVDEEAHLDFIGREEIPALAKVPLQWALPRMNVYEAHKYQKGDPQVIVAIIDTGLMEAHNEFTGRNLQGASFNNSTDPWNLPGHPHGTGCASCVAPSYDTAEITAVAPNVTIYSIRANVGVAGSFSIANLVTAFSIAVGYGADIISFSIGTSAVYQDLEDAVDYAINAGVLFVRSAGNSGTSGGAPSHPIRENGISCGSINSSDLVSSFSSYGPTVHIVAPGEAIATAGTTANDAYLSYSGTSFSCPHVAAVCALVKSENPLLNALQIKEIVTTEVTTVSDPTFDTKFSREGGIGCVNALKAVLKARSLKPENAALSFPYMRLYGANIDLTFREVTENGVTKGYLETNKQNPLAPTAIELGVYGSKEVSEVYQNDNFIYRGPKNIKTTNALISETGIVSVVHPSSPQE